VQTTEQKGAFHAVALFEGLWHQRLAGEVGFEPQNFGRSPTLSEEELFKDPSNTDPPKLKQITYWLITFKKPI
jgi:hypothetical protein